MAESKLTKVAQAKIVDAISKGNTDEASAAYGGITPRTYWRWCQKGRDGVKAYADFYAAVKAARGVVEMKHVAVVEQAVEAKDWRAAAWWLEKRRNARWGRHEQIEVTLTREAERIAKETGLDVNEIILEAKKLMGLSSTSSADGDD